MIFFLRCFYQEVWQIFRNACSRAGCIPEAFQKRPWQTQHLPCTTRYWRKSVRSSWSAVCACINTLQMCGCVSWIVALWIFLFSKKLGGGALCGYCFGNWSRKNIYEDWWVLPPCPYPSFLYLKLPEVFYFIFWNPQFSFKGAEN